MLPWGVRWRGPGARKDRPAADEERIRKPRWYEGFDIADPFALLDDSMSGFVMVLLVIVAVVIAILLALPAFIFLVELVILVVIAVVAVLVRVMFRQPWLIDAVADDGTHLAWKVVGYLKSRRVVDEIAGQLRAGTREPRAADASLVP